MFGDGSLTLREFAMREPLPLATIHDAILEFLKGRTDAILFAAQAVNAYVDEPRMTQDVDILFPRASDLAGELREALALRFTIAARVREIAQGQGFRIYQVGPPADRHLANVRKISILPATRVVAEVQVLSPEELIAQKVVSASKRFAQPKGDTDRRDLKVLLLQFPELQSDSGLVHKCLVRSNAPPAAIAEWKKLAASTIERAGEDDEFL